MVGVWGHVGVVFGVCVEVGCVGVCEGVCKGVCVGVCVGVGVRCGGVCVQKEFFLDAFEWFLDFGGYGVSEINRLFCNFC